MNVVQHEQGILDSCEGYELTGGPCRCQFYILRVSFGCCCPFERRTVIIDEKCGGLYAVYNFKVFACLQLLKPCSTALVFIFNKRAHKLGRKHGLTVDEHFSLIPSFLVYDKSNREGTR